MADRPIAGHAGRGAPVRRGLLLLGLFAAGAAWAGPVADGAAAFERGELDQAIAAWQRGLEGGQPSGRLLFDLGNAWYRKGDLPRAVAYYRAAQRRRPRDGRIHHNLALARAGLEGVPAPVGPVPGWSALLTPGELALVGLGLCLAGSAAAGLWWRDRLREGARGLLLGSVAAVLLGLGCSLAAWQGGAARVGVVVEREVALRDLPRADGGLRDRLPPGAEVRILDSRGDFHLVEDGEGGRGWIPRNAVLSPGEEENGPAAG